MSGEDDGIDWRRIREPKICLEETPAEFVISNSSSRNAVESAAIRL